MCLEDLFTVSWSLNIFYNGEKIQVYKADIDAFKKAY